MLYYAANTNRRLARVRKTLKQKRVTQIVAEVYAHIAKKKQALARVQPRGVAERPAPEPSRADSEDKVPQQLKRVPQHTYMCPFCNTTVQSKIFTGQVNHRSVCGHFFRVEGGEVRVQYPHVCPRCGTTVHAYKSSGRLRCKHYTPKGKECPQSDWTVRK